MPTATLRPLSAQEQVALELRAYDAPDPEIARETGLTPMEIDAAEELMDAWQAVRRRPAPAAAVYAGPRAAERLTRQLVDLCASLAADARARVLRAQIDELAAQLAAKRQELADLAAAPAPPKDAFAGHRADCLAARGAPDARP